MQTECPHCHTIFRLNQQQLDQADGMVRCGVCQQIFNARVQPDLFNENPQGHDADTSATDSRIEPTIDVATDTHQQATQTDSDILFKETSDHVVPEVLRDHAPHRSLAATALYALGSILLLVTLGLQYAWFSRESLIQQRWVQPYMARLCQHIDCALLQLRDPRKIELSSRNVYTHPTEDDALMVSLTLVNRAPYAQPLPDIQIEFSDVVGTVIAARRLRPQEYLNTGTDEPQPLQPDAPVSVAVEIVDPGKQALTYEFKFL